MPRCPLVVERARVSCRPVRNGKFELLNLSPGMSSFAGASSSLHLSSDSGMSNGALLAASTDASNDAASSSGPYGAASSSSALASHLGDPNSVVLTKKRLQDLVKEIDPMEVLDDEVEDVLLQVNRSCSVFKRSLNKPEIYHFFLNLP